MNRYFFEIANLKILLQSKTELRINASLVPFICGGENFDIKCEIIEDISELETIKNKGKRLYNDEIVSFYEYENFIVRTFTYYCGDYFVKFAKESPTEFEIHTPTIIDGNITYLSDILCFDIACLHFNGFKIHASFVKHDGRAIMFSAPSKTGKSTQANLWETYKNAEIINGDKAIIRKIGSEWVVFGSPWAGTSCCYKNKSAKDPALAIIRQAPENRIMELSPKSAVAYILSQTHTQCWNEEDANKLCALIEDFVMSARVFMLECRADEEAVETVNKFLLNK